MSKNIVLVGLMGSGKTTIGKLLAQKLHKDFIDTDILIEQDTNKKINEIFELYGETLFRKLETKEIEKVSQYSGKVISTGGGAIENIENLENLKSNGILFYLYAPPKELLHRIKDDNSRPLLNKGNPLGTLKKLLAQRDKHYNMANIKIETVDKKSYEIVDEIIEKYEQHEQYK